LWTIKDHIWASAAASRRHWIRLVLAAYFALAVSSVLLTNSRGGMLGLLIFAALSCITGKSVLKALIALTIGAVVMLPVAYILLPETQAERFKSLWQGEAGTSAQGSLELRKEAAIDGLRIFAE